MQRLWQAGALAVSLALAACMLACAPAAAQADDYDGDLILGVFWNSDSDLSDTLYVSSNGYEFQQISVPLPCAGDGTDNVVGAPSYVHAIHDPGLFYANGNFWIVGGYVQYQSGLGYRFTPMLSSSNDLEHWSYPNSGSPTNLAPSSLPAGSYGDGAFDSAGTEAFADEDGTVWVVTTLGYFGMNHNDSYNDTMMPYIVRVDGLRPGADQKDDPGAQPSLSYGDMVQIDLPVGGSNWLDPSLYKENGTYYLSIKKDGITNQIYCISDLNRAGDASAWTLVRGNAVTGYEGPSLTKANGSYLLYTDKLKDYPYGAADGTTGTFVTKSDSLWGGWMSTVRIQTLATSGGSVSAVPNRHGSVLRVPAEKRELVEGLHASAGWGAFQNGDEKAFYDVDYTAWYVPGVKFANAKGLMTGIGGTNDFGIGGELTRAQLATILHRYLGFAEQVGGNGGFRDVPSDAWYTGDVAWAASKGYMKGDGGSFRPNDPVSFMELMTVLARIAAPEDEIAQVDLSELDKYVDGEAAKGTWASHYLAWTSAHGYYSGSLADDGSRSIGAWDAVKRERAAVVFKNIFA